MAQFLQESCGHAALGDARRSALNSDYEGVARLEHPAKRAKDHREDDKLRSKLYHLVSGIARRGSAAEQRRLAAGAACNEIIARKARMEGLVLVSHWLAEVMEDAADTANVLPFRIPT
ncbi:MAG TPA: hypothetical protein VMS17_07575 [Gemmataceae bacterium]|nr:hypothetical protein [Gemmataceae bacterium]